MKIKTIPLATILCLAIVGNSCTSEGSNLSTISFSEFQTQNLGKPSTIETDPVIFMPEGILVYENKIIIADNYDTIIRVFDKTSGNLLQNIILKGRGPNELDEPNGNSFARTPNGVIISGTFNVVVLKENNNSLLIDRTVKLPGELSPLNYVFLLSDSLFFSSTITGPTKGEFNVYNSHTKTLSQQGQFPDWALQYEPVYRSYASIGQVSINEISNDLVKSYVLVPVIRYLRSDLSELRRLDIKFSEDIEREIDIHVSEDNPNPAQVVYSSFQTTTSDYIYIYFQVKLLGKKDNGMLIPPCILVLDWNGFPVARIEDGPQNPLGMPYKFGVDENNKKLYAFSPDSINKIFAYDIDICKKKNR